MSTVDYCRVLSSVDISDCRSCSSHPCLAVHRSSLPLAVWNMSGATVHWAQRAGTVYLTWEYVAAKDVQVKLSEKSISFSATVGDKQLAMIDMELSGTVVPAESKWFANDRCAAIASPRSVHGPITDPMSANPAMPLNCSQERAGNFKKGFIGVVGQTECGQSIQTIRQAGLVALG